MSLIMICLCYRKTRLLSRFGHLYQYLHQQDTKNPNQHPDLQQGVPQSLQHHLRVRQGKIIYRNPSLKIRSKNRKANLKLTNLTSPADHKDWQKNTKPRMWRQIVKVGTGIWIFLWLTVWSLGISCVTYRTQKFSIRNPITYTRIPGQESFPPFNKSTLSLVVNTSFVIIPLQCGYCHKTLSR